MEFSDLYNHEDENIRREFRRLSIERLELSLREEWKLVKKLDRLICHKFGLSISPWALASQNRP